MSKQEKIVYFTILSVLFAVFLFLEYKAYKDFTLGEDVLTKDALVYTACDLQTPKEVSAVDAIKAYKTENVDKSLRSLNATDKVSFKACEITKAVQLGTYVREDYTIELVEVSPMEGGIQIFARAWSGKSQVGFGDGTVDIERFKFYMEDNGKNSDVSWFVVPDPFGPIVIEETQTDIDGNPTLVTTRYREDPQEQLLMFLENVIESIPKHDASKIVPGKRGSTVSAFTSDTGGDGRVQYSHTTWSTARGATTGSSAVNNETDGWIFLGDYAAPDYIISWSAFPFDTSALPDSDTIASATLLVRQTANNGEGNRSVALIQSTQGSNTTLATTDYDERGGLSSVSEGATRVTMNTQNTDWTFTLNGTGLGWISKTTYTKLGLRGAYDIDNTTPGARNYTRVAYVENATAAYRPTLTITHSASVSTVDVTAPKAIIGNNLYSGGNSYIGI